MTKQIQLSQRFNPKPRPGSPFYAIVDDADYEWLSQWRWCLLATSKGKIYATRRDVHTNKFILMHRAILDAPPGMEVDHINGNTLDNRRENLRLVTHAQNCLNMRKKRTSKSPYKGITWNEHNQKWIAAIRINGRHTYLGSFLTPEAAHAAYAEASRKYHGAFSRPD